MHAYRSVLEALPVLWPETIRENIFLKDQLFFFRAHSNFILGRSQSRNQGEGVKGASAHFSHQVI